VNALALQVDAVAYRNFNLCPHCVNRGDEALLCRLCEAMPMISRSDGVLFHLLLADRPLAYPAEAQSVAARKLSLCFWYSHVRNGWHNDSTIVLMPVVQGPRSALFREIESVADLLAAELLRSAHLATFYNYSDHSLRPISVESPSC
jgi:hypothetical protein